MQGLYRHVGFCHSFVKAHHVEAIKVCGIKRFRHAYGRSDAKCVAACVYDNFSL